MWSGRCGGAVRRRLQSPSAAPGSRTQNPLRAKLTHSSLWDSSDGDNGRTLCHCFIDCVTRRIAAVQCTELFDHLEKCGSVQLCYLIVMWTGLSHNRRFEFNSLHLCLTSKCHTSLAQSQHKTGHLNINLIFCHASAPYYQYEAHGCACHHWATDTVFANARPWGTHTGDWNYFLTD